MLFKDPKLRDELHSTPAMLQLMADWFCQLSIAHFGKDPVVTRVLEHVIGSSGVHEIGHGVDFRCEHGPTMFYTDTQQQFLASEMNRRFPRTDGKLTCIFHRFCGGMLHCHIQMNVESTKDTNPSGDEP